MTRRITVTDEAGDVLDVIGLIDDEPDVVRLLRRAADMLETHRRIVTEYHEMDLDENTTE